MTREQGRGVEKLKQLAGDALAMMSREQARQLVDHWSNIELADVLDGLVAAEIATGGSGELLFELAASRLRVAPEVLT